ncbi:ABC transporter permease [Frondihabitans australicus]|uniref:Peptide/nickel transport system permease protein n=1 Tax=Frondihabitans australicus TaxID=386892 RepID=A0A495IE82_9MICO|nr:ABC transporter permease [Frondihabitans australicus]RKR73435.1 peptide/nickel transport system permease protein [Frondihabitans australicus]
MKILANNHLWWARRVVMLPIYLFFFAIAVFFLVRLIPGDPVINAAGGQNQTHAQYLSTQKALGLNGSIGHQLLTYLGNLVTLHLGTSFASGSEVLADLIRVIPGTVETALLASFGIVLLGFLVGTSVMLRPDSAVSRICVWIARAAGAVPDFVIGIFGILVLYLLLHIAPAPIGLFDVTLSAPPTVTGFPLIDALIAGDSAVFTSEIAHLWLPCLVLVLAYGPMLVKVLIPSIEAAAGANSTKFLVSTGWKNSTVLASVWRRAAPPAVAMFGTLFGYLLGGAVVVEQLFALQGSANYAVNAVKRSDYLALQGILLAIALISLIVFLLVDIITGVLDPRRRVFRAAS